MTKKDNKEEELFKYLLSLPGSRKAKQGVIIQHPEGIFHVRGLMKTPEDLPPESHFFLEFCTEKETRRVLEIRNATDYLLKRRADAIADNPRLVRQITTKKNAWIEAGRTWSLSGYYETLNGPARAYVQKLPKRERLRLSKIVYGLAPLNQPNGLCFRSLVGDVIIVSDSLRQFFFFWCLASLGHFYKIDFDQRMHAFIIALRIMTGAEALDFEIDPREGLPVATRSEVNADVDWMMQFTFAHEFAHYTLGHLDASFDGSGDEAIFAHTLEYAADAQAIISLGSNSFRAEKVLWAAQQVLLAFHALAKFGETRKDFPSFSVSKTHPKPVDRLAALNHLGLKRLSAPPDVIADAIKAVELIAQYASDYIEEGGEILKVYGSVYLPGFDVGHLRDRIDF